MLNFGADFAKRLVSTGDLAGRTVVELLGDVGAGKTTFTRGLAYGLGVKEPITSPSYNPENIIIVEWGESVANILPENRIRIHITYNENGSRSINLQS